MSAKKSKIYLWAENKELFTPSAKEPSLVRIPPFAYIMVDGSGDPNTSSAFRDAIGALYGAIYTLKFMLKKHSGIDFRVMPLSGRKGICRALARKHTQETAACASLSVK